MKQLLYIFGFCWLLALGFTACQSEDDDALEQLSQEQLEMRKRDSKKHPKVEYITTSANNSVSLKQSSRLKYTLNNNGETLYVFFKLDSDDTVSVTIKDMDNNAYINEPVAYLKNGKEFVIEPADHFPYYFEISSDAILYWGIITEK